MNGNPASNPTETVSVGRFYNVPAVRVATWHSFQGWLPIIGGMHEDAEIIGFRWPHYHLDWRFAPQSVFDRLTRYRGPRFCFVWPIQDPDDVGDKVILEGPTLRRMRCKRELPAFPDESASAWIPKLRAAYKCGKLINGHCPHRGIPVSAMRREGDILECPGHGLRWNAITGEAA